ncbi:MAG: hypothetical protein AAF480_05610 [Actinomycetota bacterium]
MARSISPRRLLTLAAVMAVLCLGAVASAAALNGVDSDDLAVGAAAVLDCDPDGVTVTHVTTLTTVTDLSITGIDAACTGGDLTVTLTAADDTVVATAGPITVTGSSETVAVSPNVDVSAFTRHHVRIIGP